MRSFTWQEVRRRRLARNYLLEAAPPGRQLEVVSEVGGIQAQVMSAAELALGIRVAGLTQPAVQELVWKQRLLVKTYGPRSTLHLLPAAELPLWMAAMRGRTAQQKVPWYVTAGLEPTQADVLLSAIGEALDGRCLTRQELAAAVSKQVGDWAREKLASTWGELLRPAAYNGLLCFGPGQGSQVSFVRADQWTDTWQELDPEMALSAVCHRYFAVYGPTTHQDFARWFGLEPAEAQHLVTALVENGKLEEVTVEGQRAWLPKGEKLTGEDGKQESLRLLPQYDCYLLGSGPRYNAISKEARQRIFAHGRGRYEGAVGLPVLVLDGLVAGMWERSKRGQRVELRVEPFVPLTADRQQQLEAEARRIGKFLGLEANLTVGKLD